jgi:hypothetical protein
LTSRDDRVSYRSPAASALSRFWSDPITLNSAIGNITEKYFQPCPFIRKAVMSEKAVFGKWTAN